MSTQTQDRIEEKAADSPAEYHDEKAIETPSDGSPRALQEEEPEVTFKTWIVVCVGIPFPVASCPGPS